MQISIELSTKIKGRTRRSTFWYTYILLGIAQETINILIEKIVPDTEDILPYADGIASLLLLIIFVPLIARRVQDAGLSVAIRNAFIAAEIIFTLVIIKADLYPDTDDTVLGFLCLFYLAALIICMSKDSQPGNNEWGPCPKGQNDSSPAGAITQEPVPGRLQEASTVSCSICVVCEGKGINAADHICPVCNGQGITESRH